MNFYIHAIGTTIIGYAFFLVLSRYWLHMHVKFSLLLSFAAIPLSPIVNLLIKKPFFLTAVKFLNIGISPEGWPIWFLFISLFVAPFTEELSKVLPVFVSRIRGRIHSPISGYGVGFSLGYGFGVGEIWYLAWTFTIKMPEYANGPLYMIFGFSGERFLACLIHALTTAILVSGMVQKKFWYSYFIAVGFHALVNTGPLLYQAKLISLYLTGLPISIALFMLMVYSFKLERRMRRGIQFEEEGVILYSRGEKNEKN
jgi:hypothetical protein